MVESEEDLKSLLIKVKEESEKKKKNIKKMRIMASGLITSLKTDGEKLEAVTNFIFLDSKITVDSGCPRKLKDTCSLVEKL